MEAAGLRVCVGIVGIVQELAVSLVLGDQRCFGAIHRPGMTVGYQIPGECGVLAKKSVVEAKSAPGFVEADQGSGAESGVVTRIGWSQVADSAILTKPQRVLRNCPDISSRWHLPTCATGNSTKASWTIIAT